MNLAHFLAAALLYGTCSSLAAPQATIGKTKYIGSDAPNKLEFFGGIRYAQPPVKQLRFKRPEKVIISQDTETTIDASKFGSACLQRDANTGRTVGSEDCLTINVLRPAGTTNQSKLPVMTWIHGGSFTTGASRDFNASYIVATSVERGTPVVYVSLNYRLGPMGFPLGNEASNAQLLNLGIRDQVMAINWVHDNIEAFGGDKDKVLLFGESAGAASVGLHMFNKVTSGLFRGAILQSGGASLALALESITYPANFEGFAQLAGCTTPYLDCLRNASEATIAQALNSAEGITGVVYGPMSDGDLVPTRKGTSVDDFANVPFIDGSTLDEGTFFASKTLNTPEDVAGYLPAFTNLDVPTLLKLYPDRDPNFSSPYGSGSGTTPGTGAEYKRAASILGDVLMLGPRRLFQSRAAAKGTKTYGYIFSDPQDIPLVAGGGVTHVSDILYLYPPYFNIPLGAEAQVVAKTLVNYWISFATSLNPNDGKGVSRIEWPAYSTSPASASILQFQRKNTTIINDDFRKEQTDFINTI